MWSIPRGEPLDKVSARSDHWVSNKPKAEVTKNLKEWHGRRTLFEGLPVIYFARERTRSKARKPEIVTVRFVFKIGQWMLSTRIDVLGLSLLQQEYLFFAPLARRCFFEVFDELTSFTSDFSHSPRSSNRHVNQILAKNFRLGTVVCKLVHRGSERFCKFGTEKFGQPVLVERCCRVRGYDAGGQPLDGRQQSVNTGYGSTPDGYGSTEVVCEPPEVEMGTTEVVMEGRGIGDPPMDTPEGIHQSLGTGLNGCIPDGYEPTEVGYEPTEVVMGATETGDPPMDPPEARQEPGNESTHEAREPPEARMETTEVGMETTETVMDDGDTRGLRLRRLRSFEGRLRRLQEVNIRSYSAPHPRTSSVSCVSLLLPSFARPFTFQ
ncbi:hypothetical protein R1sor_001665 [Riccia sorocarpa]|uniref:Uncharacterized protein n=1 Tax=Riccia sorocarpa TaxID=122646 RepID=A0ABD3GWK8_9MARC